MNPQEFPGKRGTFVTKYEQSEAFRARKSHAFGLTRSKATPLNARLRDPSKSAVFFETLQILPSGRHFTSWMLSHTVRRIPIPYSSEWIPRDVPLLSELRTRSCLDAHSGNCYQDNATALVS